MCVHESMYVYMCVHVCMYVYVCNLKAPPFFSRSIFSTITMGDTKVLVLTEKYQGIQEYYNTVLCLQRRDV